jgi:hypothetical protein
MLKHKLVDFIIQVWCTVYGVADTLVYGGGGCRNQRNEIVLEWTGSVCSGRIPRTSIPLSQGRRLTLSSHSRFNVQISRIRLSVVAYEECLTDHTIPPDEDSLPQTLKGI